MSDRKLHRIALGLISLALIGKILAMIFVGHYPLSLRWLEFFSIGVYFAYIGWLGFMRRESRRSNARYLFWATLLMLADILAYYVFRGWA